MRIRKLRLRNIRSYAEAELDFPEEGSILLSGNIGSGKSSVLLAVDFCLFGLQRGELSGAALLRNGESSGEAELTMLVDGKDVVIRRSLKRTSSGVSQESGSITINGVAKSASAVELKQDVLGLLSYPDELLSKSKSLIFRYTVYTPQEEMKQILTGESDVRLNTLRRVFDIDKYKRIVENSKVLSAHLRERKKEISGRVADLPVKRQELARRELEVIRLHDDFALLKPQVDELADALKLKESELKVAEGAVAKVREHKLAFSQCDFELRQFLQQREKVSSDILRIEQLVKSFVIPDVVDVSVVGSQIAEVERLIAECESKSRMLSDSLQDARTKIVLSQSLVSQISKLSHCPTCRQEVSDGYKLGIVEREGANVSALNGQVLGFGSMIASSSAEINSLKGRRDALRKSVSDSELARLKVQSFNEKRAELEKLKAMLAEVSGKVLVLEARRAELSGLVDDSHEIKLKALKEEYSLLLSREKGLVARKAALDASIKAVTDVLGSLRAEIDAKSRLSERADFISGLRDWVDGSFVSMVESMEKSVMMRVHKEFSDFFSRWFMMLVDSSDFSVRLDADFSPVIEQNGYDIEYQYLSGGEKTAAALAYRLALNQVINSVVSSVKTKDLLILDEPTDGFSAEQLDHMRDILEELKMGQVIIVSHEAKIESMVDKVIRFSKENHRTVVSA